MLSSKSLRPPSNSLFSGTYVHCSEFGYSTDSTQFNTVKCSTVIAKHSTLHLKYRWKWGTDNIHNNLMTIHRRESRAKARYTGNTFLIAPLSRPIWTIFSYQNSVEIGFILGLCCKRFNFHTHREDVFDTYFSRWCGVDVMWMWYRRSAAHHRHHITVQYITSHHTTPHHITSQCSTWIFSHTRGTPI